MEENTLSQEAQKHVLAIDEITEAERVQAEKDAEEDSRRADMKQHADKLLEKFAKLDNIAPHRAIWELVQNACDLSSECNVTLDYSNEGFSFMHNGRPFTSNTLISLIKQVSNKGDNAEVGKFGTGFITTHAFGRIFTLNSVLQVGSRLVGINDFIIDRRPTEWKGLVDNLYEQEKLVYSIIKTGPAIPSTVEPHTTFTYHPDGSGEKKAIVNSTSLLEGYIPFVLTLSETLKSATLRQRTGLDVKFTKVEKKLDNDLHVTYIKKDTDVISIYSIADDSDDIEIILPLADRDTATAFPENIARLFLYYPLIGTENLGINFLVHCKKFKPTEPRDGIHLQSSIAQVQEDEKINRRIIEKVGDKILNFIEQNAKSINNPIHLARAAFPTDGGSELLDSYYLALKQSWVERLLSFDLVETASNRIQPSEAAFFDPTEILDEEAYDLVYHFASIFWSNIPKKEVALQWGKIVSEWDSENITLLRIEDIAEKVSAIGKISDLDSELLKQFYLYLLKIDRHDLFETLDLLPNIYGNFVPKEILSSAVNIPQILIEVAEQIIPDEPKKLIDERFKLNFQFSDYNRAKLSREINTALLELTKDNELPPVMRTAVIKTCSVFPVSNSSSVRRRIVPLIAEFYGDPFKEHVIQAAENDKFDFDYTPFRVLMREFLWDISDRSAEDDQWLPHKMTFLQDCIAIIHGHYEITDIVNVIPIYPSQAGSLEIHTDLNREIDFPEEPEESEYFKDVYEKICEPLRKILVDSNFAELLPKSNKNQRSAIELATSIEHKLKENSYDDIDSHPYKAEIFNIIKRITEKPKWQSLFSDLDNRKEMIMMSKITDKDVKNDLFSIIGLDKNKIASLGSLSKNPLMERIIALGQKALTAENEDNGDFEFKKKIGLYIQDLVHKKLGKEVESFEVKVDERQGGQDLVVRLNNEDCYFIEVKSRWDSKDSISMSYLQSLRSVIEKDRYALCSVDLSQYKRGEQERYEPPIEDVLPNIRFITNIGEKVEDLISKAIKAESKAEGVRLSDDYRIRVFQSVIETDGILFDKFRDHIIEKLDLK